MVHGNVQCQLRRLADERAYDASGETTSREITRRGAVGGGGRSCTLRERSSVHAAGRAPECASFCRMIFRFQSFLGGGEMKTLPVK